MLWLWLLGCAPRGGAEVDDMMDLGAWETVCRGHAVEASARAWGASSGSVRARALTSDELGATPSGWAVWGLDVRAAPEVSPAMTVTLALEDEHGHTWTTCEACGPDWVVSELAPRDELEAIVYASHARGGGGFGGLFRGLMQAGGELIRAAGRAVLEVGRAVVLSIGLAVDVAMLPLAFIAGSEDLMFPITRWVSNLGSLPVHGGAAVVGAAASAPLGRLRVLQASAGAGLPVRATVVVSGEHLGGCRWMPQRFEVPVVDGVVEVQW